MRNKRKAALICNEGLVDNGVDIDQNIKQQASVISDNEFNESDTDFEETDQYEIGSNIESIKYEFSNLSEAKPSIISKHNEAMRNCFNEISSAALILRNKNYDNRFGASLMHSYFVKHLNDFVHLSQSVYWADKIILGLYVVPCLRGTVSNALLPHADIFASYDSQDELLARLSDVKVAIPDDQVLNHHMLPALHSLLAPNLVSRQHGVFLNSGSSVNKMCWAPVHPDLFVDQYLAVAVERDIAHKTYLNGNVHSGDHMIQIYRFSPLTIGTDSSSPPQLERLITFDWGNVTDMCWSPQPLPVVSRPQPLIGHLAVACTDGYIRIVPIIKRDSASPDIIVRVMPSHPLICLGASINRISNAGIFPTSIDWCTHHPGRIAVGYNSGHVAMYLLEPAKFIDMPPSSTNTNDHKIHLLPITLHRLFNDSIRSIKLSPNNAGVITATARQKPHAKMTDLTCKRNVSFNVDRVGVTGARLLWTEPGDMVTLIGGNTHTGLPGLIFAAAHRPAKAYRKVIIHDISVADYSPSINVIPVGCLAGKLRLVSLNASNMKKLHHAKSYNSKLPSESALQHKFYHQYMCINTPPPSTLNTDHEIKDEYRPTALPCKCPPLIKCVHRLLVDYSITISETETTNAVDSDYQRLVSIDGIAVNSNPSTCTWIAVSLRCGLIHVLPLTHFYDPILDKMTTGTCNTNLEQSAKDLFDEMLLPSTLSCSTNSGRPRKHPVGTNYNLFYKNQKLEKIQKTKDRAKKRSTIAVVPTEKPAVTNVRTRSMSLTENNVEDTHVLTRSMRRRSTKITDFFASTEMDKQIAPNDATIESMEPTSYSRKKNKKGKPDDKKPRNVSKQRQSRNSKIDNSVLKENAHTKNISKEDTNLEIEAVERSRKDVFITKPRMEDTNTDGSKLSARKSTGERKSRRSNNNRVDIDLEEDVGSNSSEKHIDARSLLPVKSGKMHVDIDFYQEHSRNNSSKKEISSYDTKASPRKSTLLNNAVQKKSMMKVDIDSDEVSYKSPEKNVKNVSTKTVEKTPERGMIMEREIVKEVQKNDIEIRESITTERPKAENDTSLRRRTRSSISSIMEDCVAKSPVKENSLHLRQRNTRSPERVNEDSQKDSIVRIKEVAVKTIKNLKRGIQNVNFKRAGNVEGIESPEKGKVTEKEIIEESPRDDIEVMQRKSVQKDLSLEKSLQRRTRSSSNMDDSITSPKKGIIHESQEESTEVSNKAATPTKEVLPKKTIRNLNLKRSANETANDVPVKKSKEMIDLSIIDIQVTSAVRTMKRKSNANPNDDLKRKTGKKIVQEIHWDQIGDIINQYDEIRDVSKPTKLINNRRPTRMLNTDMDSEVDIVETVPVMETAPNDTHNTPQAQLMKIIDSETKEHVFKPTIRSTPKTIRPITSDQGGYADPDSSAVKAPKATKTRNEKSERKKSSTNKSRNSVDESRVKQLQSIFSMKRKELLTEQTNVTPKSIVNASWWDGGGESGSNVSIPAVAEEDRSLDLSHIDDISITRSPSVSKKLAIKPGLQEQGIEKLQKILNKGIVQNPVHDNQPLSPTLLQPFHSLKLNKSLN